MNEKTKYPERQKIELSELPGFKPSKRVRSKVAKTQANDHLEIVTQWIVRVAILLSITITPWWYASVSQTARLLPFACGTVALGAMWVYLLATIRNKGVAGKSVGSKEPMGRLSWLVLPVGLGLALLVTQTTPLNVSLGEILTPHQTELYREFGSPIPNELLTIATNDGQLSTFISMDRDETSRYARLLFFSLVVMICSSLFFNSKKTILLFLLLVTANAVAISGWGLVQKASHDSGPSTQQVRDGVLSFGPFVNPNNAAGFLLMGLACATGLLAYQYRGRRHTHSDNKQIIGHSPTFRRKMVFNLRLFTSDLDAPRLATMVAVLIIAAGIIACTSRGAFIGMIVGSFSAAAIYALKYRSYMAAVLVGFSALGAIGLVQFIGVSEAASRKFSTLSDADLVDTASRIQHWNENASSITDFAPLGSGVGSYLNVHRMNREGLESRVWYFAENQYFQTALEAGIPGLLLLLAAIFLIGFVWRKIAQFPERKKLIPCLTVLGALLIPAQLTAAIFDFGLFIPANALLFAGLCGILTGYAQRLKTSNNHPIESTNSKSVTLQVLVCSTSLLAFGLAWVYLNQTYRESQVDSITNQRVLGATPESLPLKTTDQKIGELSLLTVATPTARAWNNLAHLFIHRYRLSTFAIINENLSNTAGVVSGSGGDMWALTQPAFAGDLNAIDPRNFGVINDPNSSNTDWRAYHQKLLEENFLPAFYCLQQSRAASPLQANVHLLLGQLTIALNNDSILPLHFERAAKLAPGNPDIVFAVSYATLKTGKHDAAFKKFKTYLELQPAGLEKVFTVSSNHLTPEEMIYEILPEIPPLIERFGIKYGVGSGNTQIKQQAFKRAIELLEDSRDIPGLRQKLKLQKALNQTGDAMLTNRTLLDLLPNDVGLNVGLGELLLDSGEVDQAIQIFNEYRFRDTRAKRLHRKLTQDQINR